MSDPANVTNTMPLQKINWGGEPDPSDRPKKVRRIKEAKGLHIHIHVHSAPAAKAEQIKAIKDAS